MGLQHGLGILSQRRDWSRAVDNHHFAAPRIRLNTAPVSFNRPSTPAPSRGSMASFKAKPLARPLVSCSLLLTFAAMSSLGTALGQTHSGSPIVADLPVSSGTERVIFLGTQGARALLVFLP